MLTRWQRMLRGAQLAGVALLAAACTSSINNAPINMALSETAVAAVERAAPSDNFEDTVLGLSFSGGGTRAAAFAWGVLRELQRAGVSSGGRTTNLAEQVDLVSSVSGGSVTAAYFALQGPQALPGFRERFLTQNVEASLRTSVNVRNILLLSEGGVNDRTGLQAWLDQNLFNGATFRKVFARRRPILWVNASDIYNRTPFIFNPQTFAALCSDLGAFPLSEAVGASAAVPLVFAPTVVTNYSDRCAYAPPPWAARAMDANAPAALRANYEAIQRYRAKKDVKYVKLLDGGLTDNLGLSGMLVELEGATTPYQPLSEAEAIRMKRLLFIVVDAGRPPGGDWAREAAGPGAADLIQAVADTAVDANVRSAYDGFSGRMARWREQLIAHRCALPPARVRALLGNDESWNCRQLSFEIMRVSFDQMQDMAARARLETIPTRFVLPARDVDFLADAAGTILTRHPAYQRFLASF